MEATANGVIKVFTKAEIPYYDVYDVQNMLGVGRDKAYKVIRSLRKEMITDGKLTDAYPSGKIPKRYFHERCGM